MESSTPIRSRKTLTPQEKISLLKDNNILFIGDEYSQSEIIYAIKTKPSTNRTRKTPKQFDEEPIHKFIEVEHKTSNKIVESFSYPPLIHYDLKEYVKYVEIGLPLLFYGIGSKVKALNEFILNFKNIIIISGYDQSINLDDFKNLLESIRVSDYHILVHEFDSLDQEWIEYLLELDIKLIVSVNHVNCFLLFPCDIFLKFDITNYAIDLKEIKKDKKYSTNEIKDIIDSLSIREKEIYQKLLLNYIETKKKSYSFKEVKLVCDDILSLDDEKLKRFLKTLIDHHIINREGQSYNVPLDTETCTQILKFFE